MTFIIEPFIVVVSMPITNQSQTQGEHSETTLRDRRVIFLSLSTQPRDQVLLFLPSKTIPIFGFLLSPPSLPNNSAQTRAIQNPNWILSLCCSVSPPFSPWLSNTLMKSGTGHVIHLASSPTILLLLTALQPPWPSSPSHSTPGPLH